MRQANSHKRMSSLAAVGLVISLCLGIILSGLGAQPRAHAAPSRPHGQKIAPDLRKQVDSTLPLGRIRVIVQPSGGWGSALDSTLKGEGASVKGSFTNFTARSVEINAGDVDALAARDDV